MSVQLHRVYRLGHPDGVCVCVRVSESSAKLVQLFNKNWRDDSLVIDASERGVYISPNAEIEPMGVFSGTIIQPKSMVFDRAQKTDLGTVTVPFPGFSPRKKRNRGRVDVIQDDGLPQTKEGGKSWLEETMLKSAQVVTAILNGHGAKTSGQSELPPSEGQHDQSQASEASELGEASSPEAV